MLYTRGAQQRHREGNNGGPERHRHLQTQLALVLQGVHILYFNHFHTIILPGFTDLIQRMYLSNWRATGALA